MCRMILAVGNLNMDWLIDDFLNLASDQNEKHEKNLDEDFKHGDGWGVAYLANNKIQIYRSTRAVYDDPQVEQFRNIETSLAVLHARKASRGNVVLENVHPFEFQMEGHGYFFFHNGTVRDKLGFDSQFQPRGTTDSEQLFYYFLSNSNGRLTGDFLKSKLGKIKDFSAANFILTDGATSYACNWYAKNPKYYTLKMLQKKELVIVSSEVLPHYQPGDWLRLENNEMVSVRTGDLNVTEF